ncbi:hypothetical protein ACP4OV_011435 [Aristida adscensionis]
MEDSIAMGAAPPPAPLVATAAVLTRRRAHLDSSSYRTLSRLFSHCLQLHPSRGEPSAPPAVDPAAASSLGVDCERKDAEEAAVLGSPPRQETHSPAIVEPAAANRTGSPQGSPEDVQETVPVESICDKTCALGGESGIAAELAVEDETLKSVKACLEEEVDESVEGAVDNDDEQLLLDAMMTNFSGLIDDVSTGTMPPHGSGVSGGEQQNGTVSEGMNELGSSIEENRPVGNSDLGQLNGGGFEEGEIEGELQDLDAEESGDSELGDEEDAGDQKLEGDPISRGSDMNESHDHEMRCGDLHLTPEIKGNDLILNQGANVRVDAHMVLTRAQAVSYDEVVDWNETPMPDDEAPNPGKKRKRTLTEKRKAQKTKIKRQKRAQQRIAEGVNRLKLPSVIKPKKVLPCHFYDAGKCQQGSSCKFSHDFTPSTKSKPCTHLARGSCLKGDDCPYDHVLSRHPCHKYQDGMCFRGDKCKFSHVITTTEGTSKPDAKNSNASLAFEKANIKEQTRSKKTSTVHNGEPVTSAPAKQQHSIHTNPAGISINSQKVSSHVPKGVRFLPFGKNGSKSSPHRDALPIEMHLNANGSQHRYLGENQAEVQKLVKQDGHKPDPLLNENNSSKGATVHPCSDPKKASLPTDSSATAVSVHTQHEVSEASKILQEFLFGSGS